MVYKVLDFDGDIQIPTNAKVIKPSNDEYKTKSLKYDGSVVVFGYLLANYIDVKNLYTSRCIWCNDLKAEDVYCEGDISAKSIVAQEVEAWGYVRAEDLKVKNIKADEVR